MEREMLQLQAQLQKLIQEKLLLEQYLPSTDASVETTTKQKKKKAPVESVEKTTVATPTKEDKPIVVASIANEEETGSVFYDTPTEQEITIEGKPVVVATFQDTSDGEIEEKVNGDAPISSGKKKRKITVESATASKAKKLASISDEKEPVFQDLPIVDEISIEEKPVIVAKFQEETMNGGDDKLITVEKKRRKVTGDKTAATETDKIFPPSNVEEQEPVFSETPSVEEIVGSNAILSTSQETSSTTEETPTKKSIKVAVTKKKSSSSKKQQERMPKTELLDEEVATTRKGSALKAKKKTGTVEQAVEEEELLPSVIVEDSLKPHPWAALSDTTLSRKTISELTSFLSDRVRSQ
jgi:hypothetical protein